jgi:hypothetical protein
LWLVVVLLSLPLLPQLMVKMVDALVATMAMMLVGTGL